PYPNAPRRRTAHASSTGGTNRAPDQAAWQETTGARRQTSSDAEATPDATGPRMRTDYDAMLVRRSPGACHDRLSWGVAATGCDNGAPRPNDSPNNSARWARLSTGKRC